MVENFAHQMTLTFLSDREVAVTHDFDAPRSLVFEAITGCEHMKRWWGPRGFDLLVCEIDLRPGGAYRFVQRSPDGGIHPFKGVYREIVAPERVVFTQIYEPLADHEVTVTNTFSERDGRTTLTQHLLFDSVEARDGMIASGMEWGEAQSFERLDELLTDLQRAGADGAAPAGAGAAARPSAEATAELVITREFDAPRDLVWKTWPSPIDWPPGGVRPASPSTWPR